MCFFGRRQSPININTNVLTRRQQSTRLVTDNTLSQPVAMEMVNDGHVLQLNIKDQVMFVSFQGYPEIFRIEQFHFHWGSSSSQGSEHTIDGLAYPMELHLVSFNVKYKSFESALDYADGLAVFGILFHLSSNDNTALGPIVSRLSKVVKPNTNTDIENLSLRSILPQNIDSFYMYAGSLTTPSCDEAVIWTIFRYTLPISERQIRQFRNLDSSDVNVDGGHVKLVDNFRPVQEINHRHIYY